MPPDDTDVPEASSGPFSVTILPSLATSGRNILAPMSITDNSKMVLLESLVPPRYHFSLFTRT